METIAFVTLSTGSKHKITQETYDQILEASPEDFISLPDGTVFKNSAIMEIKNISEWEEKDFDYHQPYQQLPAGLGFSGIIKQANHLKDIEAFAKGLKKAKATLEKDGRKTPKIDELLEMARKRYLVIKNETTKPLTDKEKQEAKDVKWVQENL